MDSKSTNGDDEKMPRRSFLDRFKRSQVRSEESSEEPPETQTPVAKPNFAQRMRSALSRTGEGIGSIFLGSKVIDEELFEELETSLLIADVGIETTAKIIVDLTAQSDRQSLKDGAALKAALEKILIDRLSTSEKAIDFERQGKPFVMLVVGVNGVGKTTTIGKLAQQIKGQGRSVILNRSINIFSNAPFSATPSLSDWRSDCAVKSAIILVVVSIPTSAINKEVSSSSNSSSSMTLLPRKILPMPSPVLDRAERIRCAKFGLATGI